MNRDWATIIIIAVLIVVGIIACSPLDALDCTLCCFGAV